jgi:hypothetical protein
MLNLLASKGNYLLHDVRNDLYIVIKMVDGSVDLLLTMSLHPMIVLLDLMLHMITLDLMMMQTHVVAESLEDNQNEVLDI